MRREERIKYLSALGSLLAAFLAVSVAFVFERSALADLKVVEPRLIVLATVAALTTVLASTTMLYMTRRRRLLERYRRVFIIYSREDLPVAQEIADLLRENGMEPWLDVENITAGQIWMDEMQKALDESAMAIVLLSNNLNEGSFAAKELKTAISNLEANDKKSSPLIPVVIDDSKMPTSISHIQFVDYRQKGAKAFLVKSLEVAMDRILGTESAL